MLFNKAHYLLYGLLAVILVLVLYNTFSTKEIVKDGNKTILKSSLPSRSAAAESNNVTKSGS